jgi:hypothetical protein
VEPGDTDRLSDRECEAVFDRLFPFGFAGTDVLAEIAPDGWDQSPLLAVFHPSAEQVHREAVQMHRNIRSPFRRRERGDDRPEPILDDIRRNWSDEPVDRDREVRELVGRCLWDVFSDNHDVTAPDGRVVDIGSFRGAGDFIAECLNREIGEPRYDYMDFYLGTVWSSQRADLTPVYAMIFRCLARYGFDWKYTFPRVYTLTFEHPDRPQRDVAAQLEEERKRRELRDMLDEDYRDAIERAKDEPAPRTIAAYREVYGRDPDGWPPWD